MVGKRGQLAVTIYISIQTIKYLYLEFPDRDLIDSDPTTTAI